MTTIEQFCKICCDLNSSQWENDVLEILMENSSTKKRATELMNILQFLFASSDSESFENINSAIKIELIQLLNQHYTIDTLLKALNNHIPGNNTKK